MSHPSPADARSFDAATRLEPRADGTVFDLTIHPRWTVGDKPNGGYLLAVLGRAAAEAVQVDGDSMPEALSATVTYLAAPALSAAEVHTTILRRGRTASHVRAVLVQGGRPLVDAVFVMGTLPSEPTPRYSDIAPLDIPDPDHCERLPPQMPGGVRVGVMETTEMRLDPATMPFAPAAPVAGAAAAELRGWTRFADGREPDGRSLLYFVDAIPPATLLIGSTGWVPTLSMSVYLRARPAPGWLGIRFTAHLVAAGMVDESCTVWDSRGQVVAQAWQLARLRFPDDPV
jgi:Thioesterase-like superfamily